MNRETLFVHCPELDAGGYPADCPFNSSRAGRTRAAIESMGLLSSHGRREVAPRQASRAELEMFHSATYLNALLRAEQGNLGMDSLAMGLGTPDCPVFRGMYDYVSLACGGSLTGARLILEDEAQTVFNPSGGFHHAGPASASGFCYLNDVVLATTLLTRARKRVAVLDMDAHHCDGVQEAFYDRNDVMTISLHESGKTLFPGTGFENELGVGEGEGYSVNIPLPVGTYDAAYLAAFRKIALPLTKIFDPDVIVLELGMDSLAGDPLAHLHLTNNAYADIVGAVMSLDKPVLATGGGGYNVENTVRGWALAWSVMCGDQDHGMDLGMGGVMLENTDWSAGLRDRTLLFDAGQRSIVDKSIAQVLDYLAEALFPLHGIE